MSTETEPFILSPSQYPQWVHLYPFAAEGLAFASEAHKNQRRKYTNEPYVYHVMAVAKAVHEFFITNADRYAPKHMILAALLHDTVEDTEVTFQDIANTFEFHTAALVAWLTDQPMPGCNRALRKRLNADRLQFAPTEVLIIKHFDCLDNTSSIVENDPKFAKVYIPEKNRIKVYTERAILRYRDVFNLPYNPAPSIVWAD